MNDIAYAGMDVLIIPKTARHKQEAAEFINFMMRQDMMERLAMAHSNQSPLIQQSETYRREHPNAYIDVWDKVSASSNARPLPRVVSRRRCVWWTRSCGSCQGRWVITSPRRPIRTMKGCWRRPATRGLPAIAGSTSRTYC